MTAQNDENNVDFLLKLNRKKINDDLNFSHSLQGLADILSYDKINSSTINKTGNNLLEATQRVLTASGFDISLKNTINEENLHDNLLLLADQANASLRKVTLNTENWWKEDAGALLSFMREDGRPVALIPNNNGYRIEDPSSGNIVILNANNIEKITDTAFMFFRKFPQHAISLYELLRFGMTGASRDFTFLVGCGVLGGILGLFTPYATGLLVDTVIPNARGNELGQLALLLITTAIGMAAFELTRSLVMLRIKGRMGNFSQSAIIDRLIHLPAHFFRQYSAGDLAQRAFSIDSILTLLTGTTQAALLSWVFGLFSFFYLFTLNVRLALLSTAIVFIALLVTTAINVWSLSMERRKFELQGIISSRVLQILNGISKLRSSGAEKRAFSLWAKYFTKQKELDFKINSIENILSIFDAAYVVVASLLLFAFISFFESDMSTGTFMAFNSAFTQFLTATIAMGNALTSVLNVIPLYERAKPILNAIPEKNETLLNPGTLKGNIDISHVSFRYVEDGPTILDDVSISIKPGQFVAFVGPSGSGKSTLFRMLLGFERPDTGAIYYDNQDLDGLNIGAIRRQLGVVLQNGKLMPGDIFTNIVGSAPLNLNDAWEAARMAGFEDDIKAMPMGMHTVIDEGAGTISGGQKQRLMIARAIVKKPRILLFDEATSALDNKTQATVALSIENLNSTRIVIAHRLSTVIKADCIFVLEAGRVIESGNYKELMSKNGYFSELAKRQLC